MILLIVGLNCLGGVCLLFDWFVLWFICLLGNFGVLSWWIMVCLRCFGFALRWVCLFGGFAWWLLLEFGFIVYCVF